MDQRIYWTELCGEEPMWDFDLTWNTTSPRFTNCFQQTVLVWFPSIFLCSLGSIETIMTLKRTGKSIPWNKLNSCRNFLALVCIFTYIIEGAIITSGYMERSKSSTPANIVAILMEIFNYALLMVMSCIQRSRGVHTSPMIWIFLFLEVTCSSFIVGQIFVTETSKKSSFQSLVILFRASVKSILLILYSFADVPSNCEKNFNQNLDIDGTLQQRKECPILVASFLNNLTFWWFTSMCITGFRRSLTHADLWELPHKLTTKFIFPQFEKRFNKAIERVNMLRLKHKTYISGSNWPNNTNEHSEKKFGINVVPILIRINSDFFLLGGFFKLLQVITMFFSPILLKYLIKFIEDGSDQPIWHGIFIALAMFFTSMLQCFFFNACMYHMFLSAMRLTGVMTAAIYKKSLRLGNKARQERTSGEIVNLMSVDSKRFNDLIPSIHHVWASPLQVVIAMYFLYQELGYSALFGLGVMVCMVPLNAVIAYFSRRMQVKLMKKKDDRIKSLNEILNYMRIIKFYAWEESFIRQISTFREQELQYLRRIQFLGIVTSFLWTCAPMIVSVTTFAVFVTIQGGTLTAQNAFVSLSLFNILKFPLYMIPQLISSLIMASVSDKRINSFLSSENLESYVHRDPDTVAINMENGYFKWDSLPKLDKKKLERTDRYILNPNNLNHIGNGASGIETSTLKNLNFQVKKGSFVAIVGSVGSGKSSLLSALLGEMNCVHGRINISSELKIAYVSQQAWIQNTTLKNNILFGLPYDDDRYKNVIEACALGPDIEFLPGGDETEIGEKGINLSGGQKQRVSLARACYSDADLFFLDDPLSAVDAHVAKHLFDNVLSSRTGLLRNKTRVLVTNRLDILSDVDNIIVLKNGCASEIGNYDHLMDCGGDFSKLVKQFTNTQSEQNEQSIIEKRELIPNGADLPSEKISEIKPNNQLIKNEHVETGAVKWNVYSQYFAKASTFWSCIIILFFTISNGFSISSNVWLSVWSTSSANNPNNTNTYHYLSIYVLFGGLQGVFVTISLILMVTMAFKASVGFHRDLLYRVLRSPMSFFDTTPSGRILNRFSKDLDTLDTLIPTDFRQWLMCFLNVVGTVIVISIQTPMFMLILVPIGCLYVFIQRIYVSTARQIRRLESITRSPIYSHFSETLSGVDTIRAFDAYDRFMADSGRKVDCNQICFYATLIANRWLSVRLEFCGHFIVFSAAMFAIFARDTLSGGDVGLSVSYALSITNVLAQMVRMSSLIEANIVAVERILEYCRVPSEADWFKNRIRPEPDWPREGEIIFQNYQARYRSGLDLVLRDMNAYIRPKEKIGIVGRTGAGKSTITLALFRLIEPAGGKILIDNHDISQVPLHPLRSKLAIIPQDPVLFSGTLRFNLDPFDRYSDQQIWESLSHAHLKNFVVNLTGGLHYSIAEEGKNLSVGQRQLICLARALLKKPKILFLDEATAAIDMETDTLIQKAIREDFRDCTTLTIAHRLNTVMDSDRVMVLDQGKIVEFDSPSNLLKTKNSLFYSLAKEANVVS